MPHLTFIWSINHLYTSPGNVEVFTIYLLTFNFDQSDRFNHKHISNTKYEIKQSDWSTYKSVIDLSNLTGLHTSQL